MRYLLSLLGAMVACLFALMASGALLGDEKMNGVTIWNTPAGTDNPHPSTITVELLFEPSGVIAATLAPGEKAHLTWSKARHVTDVKAFVVGTQEAIPNLTSIRFTNLNVGSAGPLNLVDVLNNNVATVYNKYAALIGKTAVMPDSIALVFGGGAGQLSSRAGVKALVPPFNASNQYAVVCYPLTVDTKAHPECPVK